ncbi:MAG TPA: hypothetical protein VFW70_14655 [Methylomirabilota bacterium]|nr:hypothetical protein [Methylomirabilota bacterium]
MLPAATSTVPLQKTSGASRGLAIRGALLVLLGLIEGALLLFAFRLNITTHEMTLVLGIFLLADGVVAAFEAAGAMSRRDRWLAIAGHAVISLAAGLMTLLVGEPWRFRIFPTWAILTGLLEGAQALGRSSRVPGQLLAAVVSVVYGLFAILGPIQYPARLVLLAAAFAVIVGALRLGGALRSR